MKLLFRLLFAFLVLPSIVMAKNVQLRILVFGDTNDSSIGQSVETDIASYKKLATDIKAAVEPEGVNTTLEIFSGDNCSYDKLNDFLEDFSCKGDIVFFIYNGHGGRSHEDESKFPRMCLGSSYVSKWMKISDLNDKLRSKTPRLMVVLTDCCNSYYDRRYGNNEGAYGVTNNQSKGEGIRHLFLHFTGEVCITAASPGEYGWCTQEGGYLSLNFLDMIYKADAKGNAANWEDFIQSVSDNTYNISLESYNNRRISNTQRPVFDVMVNESDFFFFFYDNDPDYDDDSDYDGSDFDDDDLYEDDSDYYDDTAHVGKSFGNSLWIAIIGIMFLWIPKFLKLTGNSAFIVRIIGILLIVWAIISFFTKL